MMSIFLAWIVIGLCSTMILHNIGSKVCGKYYLGVNIMSSFEKDNLESFSTDPETIAAYHRVVVGMVYVIGTIAAPITLYSAIKASTWAKKPFSKIKAENDAFVKRHGMVF